MSSFSSKGGLVFNLTGLSQDITATSKLGSWVPTYQCLIAFSLEASVSGADKSLGPTFWLGSWIPKDPHGIRNKSCQLGDDLRDPCIYKLPQHPRQYVDTPLHLQADSWIFYSRKQVSPFRSKLFDSVWTPQAESESWTKNSWVRWGRMIMQRCYQTKSQRSGRNKYCKLNTKLSFARLRSMTVASCSATIPFPRMQCWLAE